MKCPFQWTEENIKQPFKDSPPIRTRRFIDCVEHSCPAYAPEQIIKVGKRELYIPKSCRMFCIDQGERSTANTTSTTNCIK